MFDFAHACKGFVKDLDEPFMNRSPEARYMSTRIAELDVKQQLETERIHVLEAEVIELEGHLNQLQSYLSKLQAPRRNTLTKGVRQEIKDTEKQLKAVPKQIKAAKDEI